MLEIVYANLFQRDDKTPTAGLNKPPLILKKTHALTASEKPKLKLMYSSSEGFFCATFVMTVVPVLVFDEIFATLQQVSSNQHPLSHDRCKSVRQRN